MVDTDHLQYCELREIVRETLTWSRGDHAHTFSLQDTLHTVLKLERYTNNGQLAIKYPLVYGHVHLVHSSRFSKREEEKKASV